MKIVEKSARELKALIASKALSPVEVFDAFRARIEQANPAINAIVASDFARGRAEAQRAEAAVMRGDALGLLRGLPIGIKDLQLTEGLRTKFGSLVYKDNVPIADELLVARIRSAGLPRHSRPTWWRWRPDPTSAAACARPLPSAGSSATAPRQGLAPRDLDTTFETLRAVGYAQSLGDYVRDHRRLASPNVIANVELARTLSLMDVGRAHGAQTKLLRNFKALFQDIDILVCPAAAVFPFPVERVYVEEVDSVRMASYIRWVAIAYAVTLSSHPVTVIPAGLGPSGLPFGIQIVGRHRDDVGTLAAAAAIEAQLARDPTLARPRPDIRSLAKPDAKGWAGRVPPALEVLATDT